MSVVQVIITTASVLTAATVITTFIRTCHKFLRRAEKWIDDKDAHDHENYLSILRLTIVSRDMPLSERINAGDKYIALGGNGAVKHMYQELVNEVKTNIDDKGDSNAQK